MAQIKPGFWILLCLAWPPAILTGLGCVLVGVDAPVQAAAPPNGGVVAPPLRREVARTITAMVLQNFDGTTVPLNKGGDTYPSIYTGVGSTGTVSINTNDAAEGKSLQANVTTSGLYLQFNPYDGVGRGFARDYAVAPAAWQFNTYNRMSFWIKRPTTASPLITNGSHGTHVGTYVKQVTNADPRSDETGGGHYYHSINLPNDGQWTQVILNMHPDHRRGDSGGVDPGILRHPTGEPQFNYFDTLTRFYIDDTTIPRTGTYRIDNIQFYREPYAENDAQVSSLTETYDPTKNEVIVTWNRLKDENNIKHEVRYAFSDIHQLGWSTATPAPNGLITPPGWQGYNGMVYDTTALPLAGHSVVYIAIKPQNSDLFSQIAIPLRRGGPPG